LASSEANPEKAAKNLNWKANFGMVDVVKDDGGGRLFK
jgi:hypothetical protein